MADHAADARRVAGALVAGALAACAARPVVVAPPLPSYALGELRVEGAPPLDAAIAAELAPFARVVSQRVLDVSADGRAVLVQTGGEVVELRQGAAPVVRARGATWAAYVGDAVVTLVDRDGDEDSHLERDGVRLSTRAARQVEPCAAHGHLAWSELAQGGVDAELWLDDRRVFAGHGAWAVVDIAADGATLLARHGDTLDTSTLVRIDVASGAPIGGEQLARTGRLAPDGAVLAVSTTGGRELAALLRDGRDIAHLPDTDVTAVATTPSGQLAYVVEDTDFGQATLFVGHAAVVEGGSITDLHAAGSAEVLAYTETDERHARIAMRYDLATRHAEPVALARPPRDVPAVVTPDIAMTSAADGTRIEVIAFTPPRATHAPVVVLLHGGPAERAPRRYDGFVQFLVHRGYAVVMPDYRGSGEHGRAFAALDDGARRAHVLGDIAATLDWIAQQPALDARRVAVLGTSYGGYLALAAVLAYPARLRGAIALSPIVDLPDFLATTRADRRADRRAEYGDERDPAVRARLAALSPSTHVAELQRPVLIAAGLRDSRVTTADTLRWIAAARRTGAAVWSLVAADEGHGFAHAENRGAFEVLAAQFLATLF